MHLVSQLKYACFFPDFQVRYVHRPAANVLFAFALMYTAELCQELGNDNFVTITINLFLW